VYVGGLAVFDAEKSPCVYILASGHNGTLYIGVTSDLFTRVGEHKQDLIEGLRCTSTWIQRSGVRSSSKSGGDFGSSG
jgi:hypothetical protein